jgi:hypothetical protein
MNFLHFLLKRQEKGKTVEFKIEGYSCNTMLLDDINFSNYKNGRKFKYFGGQAKKSPVYLTIPESKVWHAVIDFGGYAGNANVSVKVLG